MPPDIAKKMGLEVKDFDPAVNSNVGTARERLSYFPISFLNLRSGPSPSPSCRCNLGNFILVCVQVKEELDATLAEKTKASPCDKSFYTRLEQRQA